MAISERTLLLVRQRTDVVALIGETVRLVRRGRSWLGLCPFHKEKSPSFHVTPERGSFHCFGCGEHGNAFTFLMKTEGLSFPEAVRALAEKAGVEVEDDVSEAQRREEQSARRAKDELYAVSQLAAGYYEQMLAEHPDARVARDELAKRGLVPTSPTDPIALALQAFRIGYAPAGWDGLASYCRTHGASPVAAEKVGLLLARQSGSGHYDRFRNRLMFAVVDVHGRVVAFSGRVLPDPQTGVVDKETGKYINSPESPIYKKGETVFGLFQARQAIRQQQDAVLVEGNFDVVSLHARGIENVVAPLGTAFTVEQATLLKRYTPRITLLFDGDEAGRKATRAAREPSAKAGLDVHAATLPGGKDPDDLVRERGAEALTAVLKAKRELREHLFADIFDRARSSDVATRARLKREAEDLLRTEQDETVRALLKPYADRIAQELAPPVLGGEVDPEAHRLYERGLRAALARPAIVRDSVRPSAPRDLAAQCFVGALLDFPELANDSDLRAIECDLNGDAVLALAEVRKISGTTLFELDADEFLAHLPPAFHAFARHRLSAPVHQDPAAARVELLANAEKLRRRALSRENQLAITEVERATAMGDEEEALETLRAAAQTAKRKRGMGS